MNVLLVSVGSMGDTLPFVALGKAMAARGHQVTVMANGHFREFIVRQGLMFAETLSAEQYGEFLQHQTVSSHTGALKRMGQDLLSVIPSVYRYVTEWYVPGQSVVASQGYGFGARIAHETHGVPLATIHLQPMWFRSIYDPPGLPEWVPRWFPGSIDRLIDWVLDRGVGKETNVFRGGLGLAPAKRVMKHWWNSPQLVLGFFPDWYNPPQPDWPPQTLLTGFPLLSVGNEAFDATEINRFLDAGTPPLVFAQSTVTLDAGAFYETSVAIARTLGHRAVLLTPHAEQVPRSLPEGIRHFPYVPLEILLPRSLAHIHHGGIGTIAHTLAAGIPQLTVPMVYDQPDNAQRLLRLGVSAYLSKRSYKTHRAVRKLGELLGSATVRERCREYAGRMRQTDALQIACEALERLQGTDRPRSASRGEAAGVTSR